jgi:Domain of unknown function (DUF4136)
VKTDFDRAANFSQYKTYSWEKVQTADPSSVGRIKAAVNAALAAKGWTQVESGGDISIIVMEVNRDHQTLNTYYDDFGAAGVGVVLGALENPQLHSTLTPLARLLSISSMQRPKTWSGKARPAASFPTSPTRTSRT